MGSLGDVVLDVLLAVLQAFWCILAVYLCLSSLVSKTAEVVWLKCQRDFPCNMVTVSIISRVRLLCIQSLASACQWDMRNRSLDTDSLWGSGRRPSKMTIAHLTPHVSLRRHRNVTFTHLQKISKIVCSYPLHLGTVISKVSNGVMSKWWYGAISMIIVNISSIEVKKKSSLTAYPVPGWGFHLETVVFAEGGRIKLSIHQVQFCASHQEAMPWKC